MTEMTDRSIIYDRLLELLRIALGVETTMSCSCTIEEWNNIYRCAKEHAIVGMLYKAVVALPKEQMPSSDLIGRLFSDAEYIRLQNEKVNAISLSLQNKFRSAGFATAILKGAANASLYRDARKDESNLANYRSTGDIDIWLIVKGRTSVEENRKAVIEYVQDFTPTIEARVHHIELPPVDGIPIEVHYLPMFFYSFRTQRRFEALCMQQAHRQTNNLSGKLYVPIADFNAVYQLSHILRHLFEEGVGLKQIIDYYYVLLSLHDTPNEERQIDVMREIDRLRMRPLAAAMMFVMQEAFRLPREYIICSPDEKVGRLLLQEILRGGYMGMYDDRKTDWRHKGKMNMFLWKWRFNMRLWRLCPREVLCGPLFRLWHYGWRRKNNYVLVW